MQTKLIYRPKKSLGQYFLKCPDVTQKIVKTAEIKSGDEILEIGPGTGILTVFLAKKAERVLAVEKDEQLTEKLKDSLKQEKITNVDVITADVLKIIRDRSLFTNLNKNYKVVANIPYYLTSHLLRLLLESKNQPQKIVLMIQKEVAEQIIASPPKMNILALSIQSYGKPTIIERVPASCFWPKTKVDSTIIKIEDISLDFFKKNSIESEKFFKLLKQAFSQKRKVLANSLAKLAGSKEKSKEIIEKSGFSLLARPEELSLEDWVKIYKNWLF